MGKPRSPKGPRGPGKQRASKDRMEPSLHFDLGGGLKMRPKFRRNQNGEYELQNREFWQDHLNDLKESSKKTRIRLAYSRDQDNKPSGDDG